MTVIYLRDLNLCQSNKVNMFLLYLDKYVVDTNTGLKTTKECRRHFDAVREQICSILYCCLYTCMTEQKYTVCGQKYWNDK